MPQLIAMIPKIITDLSDMWFKNLTQITKAAWELITTLIKGISDALPDLIGMIPEIILDIAENAINLTEPREIKDVYNVLQTPDNNVNLSKRMEYASVWFVDPQTMNPEDNEDLYNQIFLVSLTTQLMYVGLNTFKGTISKFYYIFEDTNVFISYPFKNYLETNTLDSFLDYKNNPSWCTDNYGNILNYYKFKCREYYNDIAKTKSTLFDNNSLDQNNRKIFITAPYTFFSSGETASFTMCIKFNYTLSNTNAYFMLARSWYAK